MEKTSRIWKKSNRNSHRKTTPSVSLYFKKEDQKILEWITRLAEEKKVSRATIIVRMLRYLSAQNELFFSFIPQVCWTSED